MDRTAKRMTELKEIISSAQDEFRSRMLRTEEDGGLTLERYVRYLSMQYHLTNGVQRHFFMVASHIELAHRRKLREFLVRFANEEELHYEIARKDLEQLGREPLPCPLDVRLWWAYFDRLVTERPFTRLGATAILENIADGSNDVIDRLFKNAPYLTPRNTRFVEIHRHGDVLPHGDQILEALSTGALDDRHWDDVLEGARSAKVLYLRMADWALDESRPAIG